jgi:lipopolysaccharide export system protein LptA
MKKTAIFLAFFVIAIIGLVTESRAQQNSVSEHHSVKADTVDNFKSIEFSSKRSIHSDDSQLITLLDNVSFKTQKLVVAKAGKVIYDKKSNKLTIYNCESFTFKGKIEIANDVAKKNIVEYTIGSDTLYML